MTEEDRKLVARTLPHLTFHPGTAEPVRGLQYTTLGDILALLSASRADSEAKLKAAEAENEQLRLAIRGGGAAPGPAASLPLSDILHVLADNRPSAQRDSELAWDGETATSWKARALAAEAKVAALTE